MPFLYSIFLILDILKKGKFKKSIYIYNRIATFLKHLVLSSAMHAWFLYQMVYQNRLRIYKGIYMFFISNMITVSDVNKCPEMIKLRFLFLTRATYCQQPSNKTTLHAVRDQFCFICSQQQILYIYIYIYIYTYIQSKSNLILTRST